MDEPPATRRSLIVKLRDLADTAAWGEFVALYEPLIYRLARRKGLQDADARDLCQEVFRTVARAVGRWDTDPARGSFRGWLSRIARNLLVNFLTRRPYQRLGSGSTSIQDLLEAQPAADPSATALFEAEYRRRLFQWAAEEVRGEFTPPTWQAFWRTAVEGRPPAAVAVELGLSAGAVYIARSRVLARLRRRIEQRGDEASAILSEVDHGSPAESL
ncbi:MAG TPA: sigma-70 family RNA polymerase sigma factor [Isosphaeraceae bacterium]|nr:sigma-70 family RNA polymerase sigma factor [Isosphaeraceae bacterium]